MRVLREPFLHFLVLGLVIFAWFFWLNPPTSEALASDEIVIDLQDAQLLSQRFVATWNRPPTVLELQRLMDNLVRQEVLVREAQSLGLDQGDEIIRNRLAQKMTFLTTSFAQSMTPDEDVLRSYFKDNIERYSDEPSVAFEQIMPPQNGDLQSILGKLTNGDDPTTLGEATLLPFALDLTPATRVDRIFGPGFSAQVQTLDQGRWEGPVQSGYGVHFVRLTAVEPGRTKPFESLKDTLLIDWRRDQGETLTDAQISALTDQYEVVRPAPEELSDWTTK